MEPGETFAACARREVQEETGIDIGEVVVHGVDTDPDHVVLLADDSTPCQQVAILTSSRVAGGAIRASAESPIVMFKQPDEIRGLPIDDTQSRYLNYLLAGTGVGA